MNMRKVLSLFVATLLLSVSYAQKAGDIESSTYIRFSSLSKPIIARGENAISNYNGFEFDREIGADLEIGGLYPLNDLDLGDGLRLGIDVTYINAGYEYYAQTDGTDASTHYLHNILFGLKVGPAISYTPVEKLFFEPYFKFCPTGSMYTDVDKDLTKNTSYSEMDGGIGFKTCAGMTISYSIISVGFEAVFGNIRYFDKDETLVDKRTRIIVGFRF